jgi:hypothetical protein
MTSIPNQSRLQFGFMKIAFAITLILTVFSSLSVWVILNRVFTKEFNETSEKSQRDLVEPTNINNALQKEIPELKAKIIAKVGDFNSFKMDEIDSQLKEAKRTRKDKDAEEKFVPIEEKELGLNPVFKLSELAPLLALKNVKGILEKQINKNFLQDKLKGNPLLLNDGLIDFVQKRKEEIRKSDKYKLEFGKKWVDELKNQKEKDKKKVFEQLDITDIKKNEINMAGLKNLLLEIDVNNYNSYFAFDYFPKNIKSIITTSNFDKDPKKEIKEIEKNRVDFQNLFEAYKIFREGLEKDNK